MKAHTGNFLDNVDEFDNAFFKISPREAKSMDPQQRVLLQAAYEALEDSGVEVVAWSKKNVVVVAAVFAYPTYTLIGQ